MKQIFFVLIFLLSIQFSFAQRGCNTRTPGWGNNLGTVSFVNDSIWKVGTQEWSAPVTATGCQKNTFDGGRERSPNADCRSNPGFGDLFSWCAVVRFANQLCPENWRVPTKDDFIALDRALGGNGEEQQSEQQIMKYINVWGGAFGGTTESGILNGIGDVGAYWSLTNNDINTNVFLLFFSSSTNLIFPQGEEHRTVGVMLRCVRGVARR